MRTKLSAHIPGMAKKSDWNANQWILQGMALAGVIWFLIFYFVPYYGLTLAFREYDFAKGFFASPWIGFQYFKDLPIEFEGPLTVGDYRVGSAYSLQETLEEMKEELAIEDEDFEDEDEDEEDGEEIDEGSVIEAQMRNIWQLVNDACGESIEKNFPLHLRV